MEGKKYDQGKIRFVLVPVYAEEELARVVTHGAEKYGDENWRELENPYGRYLSACLRHISEYRKGIRHDKDSGLHPLAHAACSLMFLVELDMVRQKEAQARLDLQDFFSEGT